MPRVVKPLTDKQVSNAKPSEKAYTLPDGQGLQLLISPDGRKSWEIIYLSPTHKKRRKSSFGAFPNISLKEARLKRNEWHDLIKQGIDPIDNKREEKAETKLQIESDFKNVVTLWLNFQKPRLAKTTHDKKENLFKNDVLPHFKDRTIDTIEHAELIKVVQLKAIQAPETSRRLFTYLNDLWQFACSHGYCKFNIVANIHRKSTLPTVKRKFYAKITDDAPLHELINSIYRYSGHISVKNALKFVLHVPLRAGNLVSLKWAYIDFETATLTIPRQEMKSKDENYDDFTLPLSEEALNILKEQYQFTSHLDFVFHHNGNHISEESPNRALQRLGFNNEDRGRKQRLHSFRGTFRSLVDTHQAEHRSSYEAKEAILDHRVGSTTERAYAHRANYMSEMRYLLEWWSKYILAMIKE